jgi:hypothetical protein
MKLVEVISLYATDPGPVERIERRTQGPGPTDGSGDGQHTGKRLELEGAE